ncbi:hypothetical protein [Halobacillus campisalis]|uniref:Uncharacterized protein n=1 Tax=Halobacillus campisalis TaxID=435909 RepID=A0ABW2K229_9BACI|nr:hypothetical protein [Halobacillus campisalis]
MVKTFSFDNGSASFNGVWTGGDKGNTKNGVIRCCTYRTEVKEVSVAAKRWSWIAPHRKASSFPATPDWQPGNEPRLSQIQVFHYPVILLNDSLINIYNHL